jgi:hypothetical protein
MPRTEALLRRQERACEKVGENALSKGMQCVLDACDVVEDADEALAVLAPMHCGEGIVTDSQRAVIDGWLLESDAFQATTEGTLWALRSAAKGAAPGASCLRTRHLQRLLKKNASLLALFTAFINGAFASGSLDTNLRALWGSCATIALAKPGSGTAPSPWAT